MRPYKARQLISPHDQFVVNDHIDPLFAESIAFIQDLNGNVSGNVVTPRDQFSLQSEDIQALDDSTAKRIVDFKKRPDDREGECFFDKLMAPHSPTLIAHA